MKELISAFSLEIFRPIVTLLIPGFWAMLPGMVAVLLRCPKAWSFTVDFHNGCAIALLVAATAIGLILEDIGSRIEYALWRKLTGGSKDNWHDYLRLAPEREPVGFGYLRSYVLRMKFETDMAAAGFPAALGVLFLPVSCWIRVLAAVSVLLLNAYLIYEAHDSVLELENT